MGLKPVDEVVEAGHSKDSGSLTLLLPLMQLQNLSERAMKKWQTLKAQIP